MVDYEGCGIVQSNVRVLRTTGVEEEVEVMRVESVPSVQQKTW